MQPIQIKDLARYRFLSDLCLSPDGARAAFLVHQCREDGGGYRSDLWLYNEARGAYALTASGDAGIFCWLDTGEVLFSSERGGKRPGSTSFYSISPEGGEARAAFQVPAPVSRIEPLDEGRFLVSAGFDNTATDLWDLDSEARAQAVRQREEDPDCLVFNEVPFWFNGEGVVNKKRERLCRFDTASAKLTPLTPPLYQLEGWHLSPGRDRVVCWGEAYSEKSSGRHDLRLLSPSGGEPRTVVPGGTYDIQFADFLGERLVMLATDGRRFGLNENPVAYRLEPDGTLTLWNGADLSYSGSVGSDCRYGGGTEFLAQDGTLYFLVTDRIRVRLCRMTPAGEAEFLTGTGETVDGFDVRAGRCLFFGARGMALQELYALDFSRGGQARRLTGLNDEALREKTAQTPRPLPFQNGGLELDGWVLEPAGHAPGQKAPAILEIHGGPKTVYGPGFFHEMQVLASAGYYVLFCNPRGGDGRGNEFADLRGRYGGIDYEDLMAFTDRALEAYPDIDRARLGVTGGSYGGFMTNWIIGHTDRFAAAVSCRSISNWVTMEGVSDIGLRFPLDQTGASTWEGFERLWAQSPLRYADRVRTPTLFLHSREDYRCPECEGLQMYSALVRFGVPARLCLFCHENHELSRSGLPRRRIRRLEELLGWFERYLR